jgi:hypothetical protein
MQEKGPQADRSSHERGNSSGKRVSSHVGRASLRQREKVIRKKRKPREKGKSSGGTKASGEINSMRKRDVFRWEEVLSLGTRRESVGKRENCSLRYITK